MKLFFLLFTLFFAPPVFTQAQPPWKELKERVIKIDLMRGGQKGKMHLINQAREMADVCVEKNPNEAGCYYYRGQATGIYYAARVFGYPTGIRSMIKDWEKALALDPQFDHGGPDRMLGEIYTDLPKHFGAKDVRQNLNKAIQSLEKSIQISPDYPTQYLDLAEAYIKMKKTKEAEPMIEKAKALIAKWPADPYFSGWQEDTKELEEELK